LRNFWLDFVDLCYNIISLAWRSIFYYITLLYNFWVYYGIFLVDVEFYIVSLHITSCRKPVKCQKILQSNTCFPQGLILFVILWICSTMIYLLRKLNWWSGISFLSTITGINFRKSKFSNSFGAMDNKLIGLYDIMSTESLFDFGIIIIWITFYCGKKTVLIMTLNKSVRRIIPVSDSFKILQLIGVSWSFFVFRFLEIAIFISFLERLTISAI